MVKKSNREAMHGRFDLCILPKQIKYRKYDYDLKGKVIYIGLAHHGKDVMMKWEEKVYI